MFELTVCITVDRDPSTKPTADSYAVGRKWELTVFFNFLRCLTWLHAIWIWRNYSFQHIEEGCVCLWITCRAPNLVGPRHYSQHPKRITHHLCLPRMCGTHILNASINCWIINWKIKFFQFVRNFPSEICLMKQNEVTNILIRRIYTKIYNFSTLIVFMIRKFEIF